MRLAGLVAGAATVAAALSPITIKGSKFFDGNGDQFFMKGVAYQLSPEDSLLDAAVCESNFALMAQAGINVIRTYHVDPWQSHDACMSILDKYGIYLILDVDTFNTTILQTSPSWTYYQMRSYQHVAAAFAKYDNVLAFFAGNEIINTRDGYDAAPAIRASIRDVKAFIRDQGFRQIPVGYSAADIAELRPMLQDYLVCDDGSTDAALSRSDFWGLNIYEWCGTSTYEQSGYAARTAELANYPVPSFFSEYGCNAVQPRQFGDIPALYGPQMSSVLSGGIVYEWIQEENDYGLVSIDPATKAPTPLADYNTMKAKLAAVAPAGVKQSAHTPTNAVPKCSAPLNLPPTPSDDGKADWQPGNALAAAPATTSSSSTTTGTTQASTSTAQATTSSTSAAPITTTTPATSSSSTASSTGGGVIANTPATSSSGDMTTTSRSTLTTASSSFTASASASASSGSSSSSAAGTATTQQQQGQQQTVGAQVSQARVETSGASAALTFGWAQTLVGLLSLLTAVASF